MRVYVDVIIYVYIIIYIYVIICVYVCVMIYVYVVSHVWERREKFTRFLWESPKVGDHSEDRGLDGRMGSEWILGRLAEGGLSGFSWLGIFTRGGLLSTW
jgi:hypothetical protein